MLDPHCTFSFRISCQWKPTRLSKVESTSIEWKGALSVFSRRISTDIICLPNTLWNFLNCFKWMQNLNKKKVPLCETYASRMVWNYKFKKAQNIVYKLPPYLTCLSRQTLKLGLAYSKPKSKPLRGGPCGGLGWVQLSIWPHSWPT